MQILKFKQFVLLFFISGTYILKGQSPQTNFDREYYHHIDRIEIENDSNLFYTGLKPFIRSEVLELTNHSPYLDFSSQFLINDNSKTKRESKKSIWQHFYKQKNAFLIVDHSDLYLLVNPVLDFSGGYDSKNKEGLYKNTRGISLRGNIANKVGFYSMVTENQIRFPEYYRLRVAENTALPGVGLYKNFGINGYDFFQARAYVNFSPIKQINVMFGHDRNFIGNGYRSMIQSFYPKENLQLKIRTKVWKLNYLNIFSQLSDAQNQFRDTGGIRPKYSALHYLGINIGRNIEIGLFEKIVFSRNGINQPQGFEVNYLNPIIFYRWAEHSLNSSDNAFAGLDAKWNLLNKVSIYSQVVFDEFYKRMFTDRNGLWAYKWSAQVGLKYINAFGVRFLDFQLEHNHIRPFTYQHFDRTQNLTQHNQSIAHPVGNNLKESIFVVRYRPVPKLLINWTSIYTQYGKDTSANSLSIGGNILDDYLNRAQETENKTAQGVAFNNFYTELMFSYMPFHNLFLDMRLIHRNENIKDQNSVANNMIWFSLRLNLAKQELNF